MCSSDLGMLHVECCMWALVCLGLFQPLDPGPSPALCLPPVAGSPRPVGAQGGARPAWMAGTRWGPRTEGENRRCYLIQ